MKRFFLLLVFVLFSLPLLDATTATAILLDISRSVPPEDFQDAKNVIRQILEQAPSEDSVTIYAFGNESRKISPAELEKIQATESYTMLFDATFDAAQDLSEVDAERKSIIIISDGLDTKSATILEDTVAFVNKEGITIYGIGVGKKEGKSLDRIARLTGGKFFEIGTPDLVNRLKQTQDQQKRIETQEPPAPVTTPADEPKPAGSSPVVLPSQPAAPAAPRSTEDPGGARSYLWIGAVAGALILIPLIAWVLVRATRSQERTCPTCGRVLDAYQTVCPDCSRPVLSKVKELPGDSTQEIMKSAEAVDEDRDLIPLELLEKKPVSEEMLTKTFVLMQTPMLVIRKGRNVGQSFSLNRVYPVSIGRSRVCEIKLEDVTISSQHCRIIPENGRHVLYDLSSTNGTFLNEKRVQKAILNEGDVIKVGETQFLFKVEQQRN